MTDTWKAARMDAALVAPYWKVIAFTLLLPVAFVAINRSLLTGVSFAMCFVAMTTGYPFSVAEKSHMERLYGILPVRRRSLVAGRYLLVLGLGAAALTVSLALHPLVLRALGEPVAAADIGRAAAGGALLYTLYTVFQLPGYYRYGAIKGRVFLYIPVAGFLATLLVFPRVPGLAAELAGRAPAALAGLVLAATVGLYALSVWVSVRIVTRKEL